MKTDGQSRNGWKCWYVHHDNVSIASSSNGDQWRSSSAFWTLIIDHSIHHSISTDLHVRNLLQRFLKSIQIVPTGCLKKLCMPIYLHLDNHESVPLDMMIIYSSCQHQFQNLEAKVVYLKAFSKNNKCLETTKIHASASVREYSVQSSPFIILALLDLFEFVILIAIVFVFAWVILLVFWIVIPKMGSEIVRFKMDFFRSEITPMTKTAVWIAKKVTMKFLWSEMTPPPPHSGPGWGRINFWKCTKKETKRDNNTLNIVFPRTRLFLMKVLKKMHFCYFCFCEGVTLA